MDNGLKTMQVDAIGKFVRYGLYLLVLTLTLVGLFQYTGKPYIYLIFTVVSNLLLYIGFRKNAIFFDAFIGIFFWLGFWLKLTFRICFTDGKFYESLSFDNSGAAFDYSLLVATCGMMGLITASFFREKFMFIYSEKKEFKLYGLLEFYKVNRNIVLSGYVILFVSIAVTNLMLGIYQRGEITQTILPLGMNGIFKWLLLFGFSSLSALILQCELIIKKEISYLAVVLSLLESMFTNVSMLSRGMILNVSALVYGVYVTIKEKSLKSSLRIIVTSFLIFAILFPSSVLIVNYMRANAVIHPSKEVVGQVFSKNYTSNALFLDRWVGIEGVMAVASNENIGWELWRDAWKERYVETVQSFYDKYLIASPYDSNYNHGGVIEKHYISLPGVLAFCFYPGSFLFLFVCLFLLGVLAALVEFSAFKLGGNSLILCALIAEVVAYRYANFGYVPAQSYLLFGTIFINLFMIYSLDKILTVWGNKTPKSTTFR